MGALSLFLVLTGGVAYAAGTIGSEDIIDNSLQSVDFKNQQVKSADVRDDSLAGGGLGSQDISADALTGLDIDEEKLGQVPSAANAGFASNADQLDGIDSGAFALNSQTIALAATYSKEKADASPSDPFARRVVFTAPRAVRITDVSILPAGNLTADVFGFASLYVSYAGGSNIAIAHTTPASSGGTGDWTVFEEVPIPFPCAFCEFAPLAAGDSVVFEIAKNEGGVVVPPLLLVIEYTQTLG